MRALHLRWVLILTVLGGTLPLSLAMAQEGAGSLSVSKGAAGVNEAIDVTWTTGSTNLRGGWIGVYEQGSPDEDYASWKSAGGSRGSLTFRIGQAGVYEFRFYENSSYNRIATSDTVRVGQGGSDGNDDDTTDRITLTVTTSSVQTGENVGVRFSKRTGSDSVWIGLYRVGEPDEAYLNWKPASGGSGTVSFRVTEPGRYEFRAFSSNSYTRLAVAGPVEVTDPQGGGDDTDPEQVTLTAAPSSARDGTVTVRYDNVSIADQAWVGIYVPSAADTAFLDWKSTRGERGSLTFTVREAGTYEFRAFRNRSYDKLAQSDPVQVDRDGESTVPTLTVDATTVRTNERVVVRWSNAPAPGRAWVGLYEANAADTAYLTWQSARGVSGSATFRIEEPGTYQFRLFEDSSFTRIAVSENVVVTGAGSAITLAVAPQDALVGERITVSWRGDSFAPSDRIALYVAGAATNNFLESKSVLFRGGDTTFVVEEAGVFDVRYLRNGIAIASSSPFTVADSVPNPDTIRNYPPTGSRVIALGDSLTAGVGASSAGTTYVARLSRRLGVPIENAGVSGDTTADALARLEADVLSKNPDLVIVFLGGNDLLQNVPTAQTEANLRQIVTRIQAQGALVVVVGIEGGLYTGRYTTLYRTLANEYDTAYVPNVLRGIIGNPRLLADLVHPNDTGYELVAARIEPTVRVLLAPVL